VFHGRPSSFAVSLLLAFSSSPPTQSIVDNPSPTRLAQFQQQILGFALVLTVHSFDKNRLDFFW